MLLHRLPSSQFRIHGNPFDLAPPTVAEFHRLRLQTWIAAIICLDLAGVVVLSLTIFRVYAAPLNYDSDQLWACLGGFVAAWLLASHWQELYRQRMALDGRWLLLRAVVACTAAFGIVLLLAFSFKLISGVSRLWLLAWAASAVAWVIAARLIWQRCLQAALGRGHCLERALVLAGSASAAHRIGAAIERESDGRIRVASSIPLPGISGAPSYAWVEDAIRSDAIDRVVIADFEDAKDETNALLTRLMRLAVDVTLMPNFQGLYTPLMRVNRIGSVPAVDVSIRPLSAGQAIVKRIEDVTAALLVILLTSPLLLLICLAIRLDSPGPVLFRQKRVGFHDTAFYVWKFRTMYHAMQDPGSAQQTSRNDRRVTRVGRFLRRTSLDELPQLVNVLRGEMSIVGPRPHALETRTAGLPLHEMVEEYASRHRIKPGITGWAQVNGCRGELDTEEKLRRRIRLDCYYIENWSLNLDAWIMLRTVSLLVFDPHAY